MRYLLPSMFGIGFGELVVIAVLLLIFVGPKELPRIASAIGKTVRELTDAAQTVKESFMQELNKDGKDDPHEPPR